MKLKKLLIVLVTLFCGSAYGQADPPCPCDPTILSEADYFACIAADPTCDESIPIDTPILMLCVIGVLYSSYLYFPKSNKTKTLV